MKRGPKPKPTALKILAGNPGKRPLPADEPKPDPGVPRRPSHVQGPALAIWNQMSKRLHKLGVLTADDGPALACLCCAIEIHRRVIDELRQSELIDNTGKGRAMRNPLIDAANSTSVVVNRWLAEFGLTPSARPRVPIARLHDADDDFLDGA